jgi:hypothetical protein
VHNDLTVTVGLEHGILVLEAFSKSDVVVDFTVDGQDGLAVVGNKRLSARV